MKLYELTGAYQSLLEAIEEGQDFSLALEQLEGEINEKVENIAKVIKSIDAQVKVIKDEEKRLADRRKAMEAEAERLKDYTFTTLQNAGLSKIKGSLLTVSLQNNKPSVVVDETELADEWLIPQPPKPDKARLYEALKEGKVIPGATLQNSQSIRIR
jgi:seryl-tRNA synthetase